MIHCYNQIMKLKLTKKKTNNNKKRFMCTWLIKIIT